MGKPSNPIEKFIRKQVITEEEEWETYIKIARQHPKDEDIQNAKQFTKEILSKM